MSFVNNYLEEVKTISEKINQADIERMIEIVLDIRRNNGRLFFLGIGGGRGTLAMLSMISGRLLVSNRILLATTFLN